jgi:hypothetical protein
MIDHCYAEYFLFCFIFMLNVVILSVVMLSVAFYLLLYYADCHYAECRGANTFDQPLTNQTGCICKKMSQALRAIIRASE